MSQRRSFSHRSFLPLAMVATNLTFGIGGCGGDLALPSQSRDAGVAANEPDEDIDDDVEPSEDESPVLAPGMDVLSYPPAPYGTKLGATIANLELYGWSNPAAVGFDLTQAHTVRLSDFYNPDSPAGTGTEYLMINVVASWCGVCRTEYAQMSENGIYATYAVRGLEMLGVIFEDNNSDPSGYVDMSNWAQAYAVAFPFVNDPGFKTGIYFDRSATPMNMIVDARTMEIVQVMTGYNELIYDQIDSLLQARGR